MARSDDDLKARKLPRQLRARATVEAIFQGAMQVLEKVDSPDASVQEIADRAGVSVGSLYQYFPSKQSLVNGLLSFHLKARMEALEAQFESARGLPAEEAARVLVTNFVGSMQPRMRIERVMAQAFCRVGSLDSLTEYDGLMLRAVENFLRTIEKDIRPVNIETAAFIICNTLRTTVLLSMVQKPERLADPAFTEELVHLVIAYLRRN